MELTYFSKQVEWKENFEKILLQMTNKNRGNIYDQHQRNNIRNPHSHHPG